MIQREIKSKVQARMVSKKMEEDIQQVVEIFRGYKTEVVPSSTNYEVEVFSDMSCAIITDSVQERIWQVVAMYELQYDNITHHLDVKQYEDRFIPCIVVCVSWKK